MSTSIDTAFVKQFECLTYQFECETITLNNHATLFKTMFDHELQFYNVATFVALFFFTVVYRSSWCITIFVLYDYQFSCVLTINFPVSHINFHVGTRVTRTVKN